MSDPNLTGTSGTATTAPTLRDRFLATPRERVLLADRLEALEVTVDTTAAPDLAAWAEKAAKLCQEWYPKLVALLHSEGFVLTKKLHLEILPNLKAAGESMWQTGVMKISADWMRLHPDEWGVVIHELTHIVQTYPSGALGWLQEGIADYVRNIIFEPTAPRPAIDRTKASYKDGYKTTAVFLDWVQHQYKIALVRPLNAALRQQKYRDALFHELTGRPLDDLWREFVATLPP